MRADSLLTRHLRAPRIGQCSFTLGNNGAFSGLFKIAPTDIGTRLGGTYIYKGHLIAAIYSSSIGAFDLELNLYDPNSILTQSFFTSLMYTDASGVNQTVTSAGASAFVASQAPVFPYAAWRWGNGSSDVWTAADVGEAKLVVII